MCGIFIQTAGTLIGDGGFQQLLQRGAEVQRVCVVFARQAAQRRSQFRGFRAQRFRAGQSRKRHLPDVRIRLELLNQCRNIAVAQPRFGSGKVGRAGEQQQRAGRIAGGDPGPGSRYHRRKRGRFGRSRHEIQFAPGGFQVEFQLMAETHLAGSEILADHQYLTVLAQCVIELAQQLPVAQFRQRRTVLQQDRPVAFPVDQPLRGRRQFQIGSDRHDPNLPVSARRSRSS